MKIIEEQVKESENEIEGRSSVVFKFKNQIRGRRE